MSSFQRKKRYCPIRTGPGIRLSAQTGSTDPTVWPEYALKSRFRALLEPNWVMANLRLNIQNTVN